LSAASRLAELLENRDDLDGLRARADNGDEAAASRLAACSSSRAEVKKRSGCGGSA
jgi:hypothetical protein